ncbi:hypothetical protein MRX96_030281 [Rhipicephalus microplus]
MLYGVAHSTSVVTAHQSSHHGHYGCGAVRRSVAGGRCASPGIQLAPSNQQSAIVERETAVLAACVCDDIHHAPDLTVVFARPRRSSEKASDRLWLLDCEGCGADFRKDLRCPPYAPPPIFAPASGEDKNDPCLPRFLCSHIECDIAVVLPLVFNTVRHRPWWPEDREYSHNHSWRVRYETPWDRRHRVSLWSLQDEDPCWISNDFFSQLGRPSVHKKSAIVTVSNPTGSCGLR